MKVIKVKDIQDGMITAREVITSNDIELIPAGTELEKKAHSEILSRWGIETIDIQEPQSKSANSAHANQRDQGPSTRPANMSDEVYSKIQLQLQLLFIHVDPQSELYPALRAKTESILIARASRKAR